MQVRISCLGADIISYKTHVQNHQNPFQGRVGIFFLYGISTFITLQTLRMHQSSHTLEYLLL